MLVEFLKHVLSESSSDIYRQLLNWLGIILFCSVTKSNQPKTKIEQKSPILLKLKPNPERSSAVDLQKCLKTRLQILKPLYILNSFPWKIFNWPMINNNVPTINSELKHRFQYYTSLESCQLPGYLIKSKLISPPGQPDYCLFARVRIKDFSYKAAVHDRNKSWRLYEI